MYQIEFPRFSHSKYVDKCLYESYINSDLRAFPDHYTKSTDEAYDVLRCLERHLSISDVWFTEHNKRILTPDSNASPREDVYINPWIPIRDTIPKVFGNYQACRTLGNTGFLYQTYFKAVSGRLISKTVPQFLKSKELRQVLRGSWYSIDIQASMLQIVNKLAGKVIVPVNVFRSCKLNGVPRKHAQKVFYAACHGANIFQKGKFAHCPSLWANKVLQLYKEQVLMFLKDKYNEIGNGLPFPKFVAYLIQSQEAEILARLLKYYEGDPVILKHDGLWVNTDNVGSPQNFLQNYGLDVLLNITKEL